MGKSFSLKAASFSIVQVNDTMVVGFADDGRAAALRRVLEQPGEATAVSGFSSAMGPEARSSAETP
jgi:hypothetical protein